MKLADKLDELFPAHTAEEYYELENELETRKNVISNMQEQIFQLNYKIEKLEALLSEAYDKIFELES